MRLADKTIIFDLDGTLIDSFPGISASFRYTLAALGYQEPSDEEVRLAVGPGLHAALENLLNSKDADLLQNAVKLYRSFHDSDGFKKSTVYPGIIEFLSDLQAQNIPSYVASMKAGHMIKPILKYFELERFFIDAVGSNQDGSTKSKAEMLLDLSKKYNFCLRKTILVGDTLHDAKAAKEAEVDFFAVTYGYGLKEELEQYAYLKIFEDVENLRQEFLSR
jgi:phosphoglycolate phosphatase